MESPGLRISQDISASSMVCPAASIAVACISTDHVTRVSISGGSTLMLASSLYIISTGIICSTVWPPRCRTAFTPSGVNPISYPAVNSPS